METHLRDLSQSLIPFVDVSVIVANDNNRSVSEFDGDVPVRRIATWAQLASAPICPALVAAIRRTQADIVHIHVPNPTAVLALLSSRHPGRIVVTYQSDIVRQRLLSRLYDPFDRVFLRRADAIVCLSPNYIESSEVLTPFRSKCHVIPHGIDPRPFEHVNSEAVAAIRARYGPRIVLGVGRLVYYKGFDYLIRAMSGSDANLVLIGDGPLRDSLAETARQQGVSDRVHFLGEVPNLIPYYQAADMLVLPSIARSEAFGIVQLEAMACGTPVINTSLDSGVPFVSLHNVSGLTVPPADVTALQTAMQCLLRDDTLRHRLSSGARQRVRAQFTTESMALRTLQLYENVLGREIAEVDVMESPTPELTPQFSD
jgi:rhamnosyl/mannosyltransferase